MRKILIIISLLVISTLSFGLVEAQTPTTSSEVVITWQANNFYPSNYQNKAPATRNSEIFVSLELIEDNRMVNLSESNVTWYLDGIFLRRGNGMDEISFTSKKLSGNNHTVRAIIKRGETTTEKTVLIPVEDYEVVIEAPLSGSAVELGNSLSLKSFPYFFNVESIRELTFNWRVNNDRKTDVTNEISLNIGNDSNLIGSRVLINSSIINKNNPTESAEVNKNLTIID